VNLTGWSDVAAGTGCGAGGAVCAGGVCLVGCQVGGILYGPGSPSPTDPCQTCQPAISSSAFSPFNGLPTGGCNGGQTCNQGTCEVACFISGVVHASRTYKPNDTGFCCSPNTDPSAWTPTFVRGGTYNAGTGSASTFGPTEIISAGDFNADGFQDVAVVNSASSTISIFLNRGDGTFDPQAVYPTGANPQAVATGDLNGDSLDDVVVAANGTQLGTLLSLGFDAGFDAGLMAETDTPITGPNGATQTMQILDLNGDLAPDLVAGNASHDNSVSVYLNLNDGSGRFFPEARYNPGLNFGNQVALGDFDGDGSPDIAILQGGFGGNAVAVLFNSGTGSFSAGATFPIDNFALAVTAGDFNADGFSDLAAATFNQPDTLTAIGDGGFFPRVAQTLATASVDAVGAADLNGDGLADLVVLRANTNPGTINLLVSQGPAGFLPASTFPASVTSSLVIKDFNGDGAPDLAIVNVSAGGAQSFTVWFNSCP
jgi:hypothetical protein